MWPFDAVFGAKPKNVLPVTAPAPAPAPYNKGPIKVVVNANGAPASAPVGAAAPKLVDTFTGNQIRRGISSSQVTSAARRGEYVALGGSRKSKKSKGKGKKSKKSKSKKL